MTLRMAAGAGFFFFTAAALVSCIQSIGALASDLSSDYNDLLQSAVSDDSINFLLKARRSLHQTPELGLQENLTNQFLRSTLDSLRIYYDHPVAGTGVIGTIGTGDAAVVALRADIDGLPIQEPTHLAAGQGGWASQHPGRMHACGHDAHMSMLLGAARLLKQREATLKGTVLLVFQPAEEGGGGASKILDQGILQAKNVTGIAGVHVWPALPTGTIATKAGPIMAASDRFSIMVNGRGGHGAMPHLTADPVVAASAIVMALQPLVSRETSPTDGAVVTVAGINSGADGAFNVIPEAVELKGTIRALTQDTMDRLRRRVADVAAGTAQVYGCSVTNVTWSPVPYRATINDPRLAEMVLEVAKELQAAARKVTEQSNAAQAGDGDATEWKASSDEDSIGHSHAEAIGSEEGSTQSCTWDDSGASGVASRPACTSKQAATGGVHTGNHGAGGNAAVVALPEMLPARLAEPSMAAEDFSFYGDHMPAVFTFLGIGNEAKGTTASLHNPAFQMDEDMLPVGAALHAAVAIRMIQHALHSNTAE